LSLFWAASMAVATSSEFCPLQRIAFSRRREAGDLVAVSASVSGPSMEDAVVVEEDNHLLS
jgi:hypothetical protein